MSNWTETEHCHSRQHCTACPYALERTTQVTDTEHAPVAEWIGENYESPLDERCPFRVTLEQALEERAERWAQHWLDGNRPLLEKVRALAATSAHAEQAIGDALVEMTTIGLFAPYTEDRVAMHIAEREGITLEQPPHQIEKGT